jgi:hypothetical protein
MLRRFPSSKQEMMSMSTTESQIDMQRVNVPQLKEFLAFSVKDRYQLKKILYH